MNSLFIKYQQAVDKLPIEARAIVLAMTLGLIFVFWYYGFWQGLQTKIEEKNKSIKELEINIPALRVQFTSLEKAIEERKEIERARQKTEAKDQSSSLRAKTDSQLQLIPSQKLREVLQDLLMARSRLVLLQLQNLPSRKTLLPSTNTQVFEHSMVIKFKGDYFSTMSYLQAIEKLGWQIYWDKLEYKVVQYPTAEITLQIHTISNQGELISV